jgi:hypothetical protein
VQLRRSGTRDWMNSVAWAGSTPAASQSITMSQVLVSITEGSS